MEDIAIPMLYGNMEDIAGETSTVNGSETNNDSSVSTQQQYERERRITIDYTLLPENLKDVEEEDIKKTTDKLTKIINDLQNTIQRIQAPNMKVRNKLEMMSINVRSYKDIKIFSLLGNSKIIFSERETTGD